MNSNNLKTVKRLLFIILFATALSRSIMLGDLWMIIVSAVIIPALFILDIVEKRKI